MPKGRKLLKNRAVIFTTGMIVGPIVVYAVFRSRIAVMVDPNTIHLLGDTRGLKGMLDGSVNPVVFNTPVGPFELVPVKK